MKRVDSMPYWKNEQKCYEETKVEAKDQHGKIIFVHWPRNKPSEQVSYETWQSQAVNPETDEFHMQRDKKGNTVKGTGAKYVARQIVRLRRPDGSEYLYSNGMVTGFDALGDEVHNSIGNPEVWNRTHFMYKKDVNPKTKMLESRCVGPSRMEPVYEMPFNEKNLKELFNKRIDDRVAFCLKDEQTNVVREVKDSTGIVTKSLELFMKKDFDYLANADYLPAQLKADLRQQAMDMGLIPSRPQGTQQQGQGTQPKTGAYS